MPQDPNSAIDRLPPPHLVEDESDFSKLLDVLAGVDVLAVDTEADSFFHYREKVCLIQVTAAEEDYLVDPLADFDLGPLGEVFADPTKRKIFHDGEYDVTIMKRDYGFRFAGLYDTRVAAAALGQPNPGLASVLRERFDIELDKSMQRSDWSQRPLSAQQVSYARLDTRFLVPLMEEQLPELRDRDRLRIVEGECRRLEALEPPDRSFNPDEFIRMKGARDLSNDSLQALRELFVLRDQLAASRDRPPFKVLGNQVLIEIARALPRNSAQLGDVPGVPMRQVRRVQREILDALGRAREKGPLKKLPRLPSRDGTGELDEEQVELHDRLRAWRRDLAQAEEMDSSLILNRLTLLELARLRPGTSDEVARVESLQPWQVELFAEPIAEVVRTFEQDLASGELVPRRRRRRER